MSPVERMPPVSDGQPPASIFPLWILSWPFVCGLLTMALLALENAAVVQFAPRPWPEGLYLARIATLAGVLLGLPAALLRFVDGGLPDAWRPALVTLVSASAGILTVPVGAALSQGDGLPAGLTGLVRYAVPLGVSALAGCLWFWACLSRLGALGWLFGLGCAAASAWVGHAMLRTYAMLGPVLLPVLGFTLTSMALRALKPLPARTSAVLIASTALLFGSLWAIGASYKRPLVLGRRTVLRDATSAQLLDRMIFDADPAWRSVRFDIAQPSRFDCERYAAEGRATPAEPALGQNVILISIDALRADALTWKRGEGPLMPNLVRFTGESRYAPRAQSSYPATMFAMAGAVTGLAPSQILFSSPPPASLFTRLRPHLHRQLSILPTSPWFEQPAIDSLVLQGIATRRLRGARAQTTAAIQFLSDARRRNERHLMWLHYLEPHAPYQRHRGFDLGTSVAQRYRSELAFLDRELGRLFRFLRRSGAYEDSLVVLFADHGQALGEREYIGHHVFLNGWIMDIPMAWRGPGVTPGVVQTPVQVTDVAPTVLRFLGQPVPGRLAGRSLLAGDPPADRALIAEAFPLRGQALFDWVTNPIDSVQMLRERIGVVHHNTREYHPKVSLVEDGHRLLVRRYHGATELHRLDGDPLERDDLSEREPAQLARMLKTLAGWHRDQAGFFYCEALAAAQRPPPPPPAPNTTPAPRQVRTRRPAHPLKIHTNHQNKRTTVLGSQIRDRPDSPQKAPATAE